MLERAVSRILNFMWFHVVFTIVWSSWTRHSLQCQRFGLDPVLCYCSIRLFVSTPFLTHEYQHVRYDNWINNWMPEMGKGLSIIGRPFGEVCTVVVPTIQAQPYAGYSKPRSRARLDFILREGDRSWLGRRYEYHDSERNRELTLPVFLPSSIRARDAYQGLERSWKHANNERTYI